MNYYDNDLNFLTEVKAKFQNNFQNAKVLEVGSLFDRFPARLFFEDCDYTGIDLSPGIGVDLVKDFSEFECEDDVMDTVLFHYSLECNENWIELFKKAMRICKPDGLIIAISSAAHRKSFRRYHNFISADSLNRFWLDLCFSKYEFIDSRSYSEKSVVDTSIAEWYNVARVEMLRKFDELYGHRPDYEKSLETFEKSIHETIDSTFADLKPQDEEMFFYGVKL